MVLVVLAFSDEFFAASDEAMDLKHQWDWLLFVVDALILAAVLLTKTLLRRKIGGQKGRRIMLWWLTGAALTLGLDVVATVVLAPKPSSEPPKTLLFDLISTPIYVLALALVLVATLDARPGVLFRQRHRDARPHEWGRVRAAIPLLIGTLAAYFATTWWEYHLSQGSGVDQEFFAQMSQVIALLIVALGVEVGFFRNAVTDPSQRPITIFAVFILCLGEIMALSALTKPGDELYPWHMYTAFVIVVEASLVAFATLIWVLVVRQSGSSQSTSPAPCAPVSECSIRSPITHRTDAVALFSLGLGIGAAFALTIRVRRRRSGTNTTSSH